MSSRFQSGKTHRLQKYVPVPTHTRAPTPVSVSAYVPIPVPMPAPLKKISGHMTTTSKGYPAYTSSAAATPATHSNNVSNNSDNYSNIIKDYNGNQKTLFKEYEYEYDKYFCKNNPSKTYIYDPLVFSTINNNIEKIINKTIDLLPIFKGKFDTTKISRYSVFDNPKLKIDCNFDVTLPQSRFSPLKNNMSITTAIEKKYKIDIETTIKKLLRIRGNLQYYDEYKYKINDIIEKNFIANQSNRKYASKGIDSIVQLKKHFLIALQIVDSLVSDIYNKIVSSKAKYVMIVDLENLSLMRLSLFSGSIKPNKPKHITDTRFDYLLQFLQKSGAYIDTQIHKDKIVNIIKSVVQQLYNIPDDNKIFVIFVSNQNLTSTHNALKIFSEYNDTNFNSYVITSGTIGDDVDDLIIAFMTETIKLIDMNVSIGPNINQFLLFSYDNYKWWNFEDKMLSIGPLMNICHCELTDEYKLIYRPREKDTRCDFYSLSLLKTDDYLFQQTDDAKLRSKCISTVTKTLKGGRKKYIRKTKLKRK